MKNQLITLASVQSLHQAGQLAEAETGYLELLKQDPNNTDVLHLLGVLYAEQGRFDEAELYLQKALKLHADPGFALHLANILKAQGMYGRAAQILEDVIANYPDYAPAFNNLGTIYFAQAKFKRAIEAYHTAIALKPDYVDAYYNLGLSLQKSHQLDEAYNAFQAVLEFSPNHVGANFHMGCLLMQQKKYQKAINFFTELQKIHPDHVETQTNLATCYLELGLLVEAKTHYLNALKIEPDDSQVLFNLGVISVQQNHIADAVRYYQQLVRINPEHFEGQNNLAVLFLGMRELNDALQHFYSALKIRPNNEAIKHTIDILTKKQGLSKTPTEYVRNLFDAYANHYDSHLNEALQYKVPDIFYEIVTRFVNNIEDYDILDLGCGTGLCGTKFREKAKNLVGVDLSAKMLGVAKNLKIYDELVEAEVLDYIKQNTKQYDLVLGGDVLVYFGELDTLFSQIKSALKEQGFFIFNTEISEDKDYQMTSSGRFAHSKSYLDQIIANNHFKIIHHEERTIRTQENTGVWGYIYLLGRG